MQYEAKQHSPLFVINPAGVLIYQGAIDDEHGAWSSNPQNANNYVIQALEAALAGMRK